MVHELRFLEASWPLSVNSGVFFVSELSCSDHTAHARCCWTTSGSPGARADSYLDGGGPFSFLRWTTCSVSGCPLVSWGRSGEKAETVSGFAMWRAGGRKAAAGRTACQGSTGSSLFFFFLHLPQLPPKLHRRTRHRPTTSGSTSQMFKVSLHGKRASTPGSLLEVLTRWNFRSTETEFWRCLFSHFGTNLL